MTKIVLAALIERRAYMAGELNKMQTQIQQMHADLASLDVVIKQFDPDYRPGAIRTKYRRQPSPAEFGAMGRAVLDTLRRAEGPLSVKDIAAKIIAERGLNAADRAVVRSMAKRVDMALRYQRTNGMVAEVPHVCGAIGWRISD